MHHINILQGRLFKLVGIASFSILVLVANVLLTPTATNAASKETTNHMNLETATFAGGCFWCTEAIYQSFDGVHSVKSGYMGGHVENPTYEQICTGDTNHAEVIQIEFDPDKITFKDLVDFFWDAHDPTTLNRQGADVGTQYRSAIFFHSGEQESIALTSKDTAQAKFKDPIVTEITAASTFYPAEDYHQDYYSNNKYKNRYCQFVIMPKLKKMGIEK